MTNIFLSSHVVNIDTEFVEFEIRLMHYNADSDLFALYLAHHQAVAITLFEQGCSFETCNEESNFIAVLIQNLTLTFHVVFNCERAYYVQVIIRQIFKFKRHVNVSILLRILTIEIFVGQGEFH